VSFPEKLINSRISSATAARVWPVMAGQNAPFPLVVYRRTGTRRDRSLTGGYCVPVATVSVAIVSETYVEVKEIAEAIRLSLDNFTGDGAGVKIIKAALVQESDNMEPPLEGRDKPLYRVDQVYEVRFQE